MKTILSLFLGLLSFVAVGQNVAIKGKIVDKKTKSPALFTSVLLLNPADSTLINGTLTDSTGTFTFFDNIPQNVLIAASSVEYNKQIFGPYQASSDFAFLNLELEPATTTLGEVKVVGQRPLFEQKFGNTIINVDSKLFKAASNVLEIFKRSPGILVDASGNITFRGTSPKVLFNGKDLRLGAEAEKNYLKSLSLDQIESIELMPVPPAKFEGAFSTVVNVILKKDKNLGYKGSVFVEPRQNRYFQPMGGVNLGYKAPKWAYLFNVSLDKSANYQELYNDREGGTGPVKDTYDMYSYIKYITRSINFVGGLEYQMNPNSTLDLKLIFDQTKAPTTTNTTTNAILNAIVLPQLISDNYNTETAKTNSAFGGYKYQKNGTEINFEVGLSKSKKDGFQELTSQKYQNKIALDGIIYSRNITDSEADFTTFNGSFAKLIQKKWQFETGFKINIIKNTAQVIFDTLAKANVKKGELFAETDLKRDANRTNKFGFDENVNMFYTQLNRQWTKLSGSFGIRFENTQTEGNSLQKVVNRNYWNFLPTLNFTYKLTENSALTWNNGRKISRPGVWQLNPFVYYLDAYTHAQGDPLLFAQIRSASELSWNYKQLMLITGYNHYKNKTSQLPIYDTKTKITTWQQSNVDGARFFFDLSHSKAITLKWTYQCYLSSAYEGENTVVDNRKNETAGLAGYFYLSNSFTLPKAYTFEVSGSFVPATKSSFFNMQNMYGINLALQKSFAKNKWNLQANMYDVFWTNVLRATLTINDGKQVIDNRQATRGFNLRLTRNFGTSQYNSKQSKSGAREDAGRIK